MKFGWKSLCKGLYLKWKENRWVILSFTYSNEAEALPACWKKLMLFRNFKGAASAKSFCICGKEFRYLRRFRLEVTHCNERAISLYRRLGYEELDYIQMIKDR